MSRRLAVLGAAMALLAAACGSGGEPEPVSATIPDTLEWITPEELTGKLSAGGAAVVNFWASWCGPCRAEAPVLRRVHEEYGEQVRFIGVAVDDTPSDAFAFMESHGIAFENYLSEGNQMMAQYEAFGIPFTVFTDTAGEVLYVHRGIIDEGTLSLWSDELSRLG
nr:TlpA disulfide reductase family protein [bacterium]